MYQYILKNYRNIQLLSDFTNSAYVTALQKVNLNEKKRKSRTIVTYMYVKKWEDNMNSKIDRVKCIIRWQKTLSDDIHTILRWSWWGLGEKAGSLRNDGQGHH